MWPNEVDLKINPHMTSLPTVVRYNLSLSIAEDFECFIDFKVYQIIVLSESILFVLQWKLFSFIQLGGTFMFIYQKRAGEYNCLCYEI